MPHHAVCTVHVRRASAHPPRLLEGPTLEWCQETRTVSMDRRAALVLYDRVRSARDVWFVDDAQPDAVLAAMPRTELVRALHERLGIRPARGTSMAHPSDLLRCPGSTARVVVGPLPNQVPHGPPPRAPADWPLALPDSTRLVPGKFCPEPGAGLHLRPLLSHDAFVELLDAGHATPHISHAEAASLAHVVPCAPLLLAILACGETSLEGIPRAVWAVLLEALLRAQAAALWHSELCAVHTLRRHVSHDGPLLDIVPLGTSRMALLLERFVERASFVHSTGSLFGSSLSSSTNERRVQLFAPAFCVGEGARERWIDTPNRAQAREARAAAGWDDALILHPLGGGVASACRPAHAAECVARWAPRGALAYIDQWRAVHTRGFVYGAWPSAQLPGTAPRVLWRAPVQLYVDSPKHAGLEMCAVAWDDGLVWRDLREMNVHVARLFAGAAWHVYRPEHAWPLGPELSLPYAPSGCCEAGAAPPLRDMLDQALLRAAALRDAGHAEAAGEWRVAPAAALYFVRGAALGMAPRGCTFGRADCALCMGSRAPLTFRGCAVLTRHELPCAMYHLWMRAAEREGARLAPWVAECLELMRPVAREARARALEAKRARVQSAGARVARVPGVEAAAGLWTVPASVAAAAPQDCSALEAHAVYLLTLLDRGLGVLYDSWQRVGSLLWAVDPESATMRAAFRWWSRACAPEGYSDANHTEQRWRTIGRRTTNATPEERTRHAMLALCKMAVDACRARGERLGYAPEAVQAALVRVDEQSREWWG